MDEIEPCPSCGALPCDWVDNPHQAALAATPLDAMREALAKARDTFQHYGDLHKAKDTGEGHQKAAVNYALALEMDEALAARAALAGGE